MSPLQTPASIRVLMAKPGLDGHDVGAKLVCRALLDAGMEVVYTGLRQSPQAIAHAARDEAVHALGLSMLAGAHLPLCGKVARQLKEQGLHDLLWFVGGNIPQRDHAALHKLGVDAIFATGSRFESIVEFINRGVKS